jgi:hypothetical protein
MATLLGPGIPAVDAAAAEARETFRRLRATAFLDRLEGAMGWSTGREPTGSTPVAADLALDPTV